MIQEWEKLTPFEQVRLRTEWVFGSRDPQTQTVLEYGPAGPRMVMTTWVPALFTCFREILDNALDEVVTHKHGNRIDVCYDAATLSFSIADNGRGIPIEWSDEHQGYAATILLSEMMSGRNFIADRGETRGLNGIGAKGVNYCSHAFKVEVQRGKYQFIQQFNEGPTLQINPPTIWPINSRRTGTKISCTLSQQVFPHRDLPLSFIVARLHEIALCYPKLHLTLNGQRIASTAINLAQAIPFTVESSGFTSRFWLLPYSGSDGDFIFSLVNAIPVFNGGTHIDAFRRHFYAGLLNGLARESRRRKLTPNRADVSDGLLVYNVTEMQNPSFDSQSKTRLINETIAQPIRQALDAVSFYRDIITKHPNWIDAIYNRCAIRTQTKDSKDVIKQAKRNLRQKIEDLEDACGHDRSKCILFLAEGDSAISGLVKARDPDLHGGLPLLGKVLNVFGESNKRILENTALAKVMTAIGLIPGQPANRPRLRYGKIYITTDADHDGANIAALLVGFFHTCWPELFDPAKPPFIHIFNTPLIIAVKGKQRRYWYAEEYATFDNDKFKHWEITRAKGLAALVKEDWKHILQHPRIVPIVDDGRLRDTLNLLFDAKGAAKRREWMAI